MLSGKNKDVNKKHPSSCRVRHHPSPDDLRLTHWISISSRAAALFASLTFDLPEEKREFPSVVAHSTTGGFIWVLSGMWWFSSHPPQSGEPKQGYEGQVVGVVKVRGHVEVQPTKQHNNWPNWMSGSSLDWRPLKLPAFFFPHSPLHHSSPSSSAVLNTKQLNYEHLSFFCLLFSVRLQN